MEWARKQQEQLRLGTVGLSSVFGVVYETDQYGLFLPLRKILTLN